MTCGEFLKILQEHPEAELIFEQLMEPQRGHSMLVKRLNNLKIHCDNHEVIICYNPF